LKVQPLDLLLGGVGTSLTRIEGDEVREDLWKKRCRLLQTIVLVMGCQDDGVQGVGGRAGEEGLEGGGRIDTSFLDGIKNRGQITDIGRVWLGLCDKGLNKRV
jgi:hypothetical protein